MKQVIMQSCGKAESVEEFYDWKVGQEASSGISGFEYAMYNTKSKKITGFYALYHTDEDLVRGQQSVFV